MEQIALLLLTLMSSATEVSSSAGNLWTYRGALGPNHWHLDYPHCGGIKQSPISIATDDVIVNMEHLTPIVFKGYDSVSSNDYTLSNNGHTVQVTLRQKTSEITGGGLPGTYVAEQFHFHWGAMDKRGSEHDVNGEHFPMEMHIVHHKKDFANVSVAMDKEDGLAVLGFFFQIGRYNSHFQEIINHFVDIQYKTPGKDEQTSIHAIPLVELMPASLTKFYRYEGSLTTPPCYESVVWTLFNETIEIAEEQLEDFRTMIFENDKSEGGVMLDVSDDFRPPQCMFHRQVYASHPTLKYSHMALRDAQSVRGNAGAHVPSFVMFVFLISSFIVLF